MLRLLGINPDGDDEKVTEEEIRMLLMEGSEDGTIDIHENEIIQNVFEFDDISVEQICTHRIDVIALYITDDIEKWEDTIYSSRHTYYPVCGESNDDIIGILNTKEYFGSKTGRVNMYWMQHLDKPYFVPESMKANVLFQNMKNSRIYFAVVLDEYGGLSGIITVHDLIEEMSVICTRPRNRQISNRSAMIPGASRAALRSTMLRTSWASNFPSMITIRTGVPVQRHRQGSQR